MVCRICLEEEGPFIHPCECIGTMKDVHELCLFRWVQTKDDLTCELCGVPIVLEFNYAMERTAYFKGMPLHLLTNPAAYIMMHCIILIFFCTTNYYSGILIGRFIKFQLAYNGIYLFLLCCVIQEKVLNKGQYLFHLLSFPRVFVILGQIVLWIQLIETQDDVPLSSFILRSLLNQSYMALYPYLHNHILDRINERRIPTLILTHSQEDSPETIPS